MFLKFWIISTAICLICLFTVIHRISATFRSTFTTEQRKELKRLHKHKKSKYPWFIIAFVYLCPIINIIVMLIIGLKCEEIEKEMMHDWKKELGILTPAEKFADSLAKTIEKVMEGK